MIDGASILSGQSTSGVIGSPRTLSAVIRQSGQRGAVSARAAELSPEEEKALAQLRRTDREVRAHEQAHLSVGADLIRGGPSFTYELGPDNRRYAISGEVTIDTSPGRTPEETIPKAQHIRATALAPADPSAQDFSVANKASRMESSARIELALQRREESVSGEDRLSYRLSHYYGSHEIDRDNPSKTGGGVDLFA